jgi:hypothetical protein
MRFLGGLIEPLAISQYRDVLAAMPLTRYSGPQIPDSSLSYVPRSEEQKHE